MRILFLSNFYPPASLGGYELWCQEVGDSLRDRGHDVMVLTSDFRRTELPEPDSKWIHRGLHLQMDLIPSRNAIQFFTSRKINESENLELLQRTIEQFSPDRVLIWGMWNLQRSLPALVEDLMPGRVAYYLSDYWPTLPNQFENYWHAKPRNFFTGLPKLLLKPFAMQILAREKQPDLELEHAVCCSEYVRNTLAKAGKLPHHAGIILGGTDPKPFLDVSRTVKNPSNQQNKSLRLLYYGRLVHEKGVHTAIQSLGLLKERGLFHNLELTILGGGDPRYEARLRQMAVELGVSEKIDFVGSVQRNAIPDKLAHFDVYMFTSIWPEPMARSVMEAMAAELLVIGTDVGGQAEMLIHEENALTFKPEDAEGLADNIFRAFYNPQLRLQLARAGRLMVLERFTLIRMVDEIEVFLQNIASPVASDIQR